jgi:hypothetical protein
MYHFYSGSSTRLCADLFCDWLLFFLHHTHTHKFYMLTSALLDFCSFFLRTHTHTNKQIFYNFVYSLF